MTPTDQKSEYRTAEPLVKHRHFVKEIFVTWSLNTILVETYFFFSFSSVQ